MIKVDGLRKEYGSVLALSGISFEVPKGQVLGFLGPNGAGKSTTLKILTTFIQATEGNAILDGFSVRDQPNEVRKRVGYLPEHAPLYLEMTVYDYLDYAARSRDLGSRQECRRAIARVVDICTLYEVIGRRIGHLSKGFRQRVGLAQAMIHDPDILILDEPTSGLDPIQIGEIRSVIRRMGEERSVLFSTHIIPEVELSCDRVLVIDKGKLVGDGKPEELRETVTSSHLLLRWKGDKEQAIKDVKELLGHEVRVDGFQKNDGISHLTIHNSAPEKGHYDKLASAFSGQGQFLELREEKPSLEEAFFSLVGRRTEHH
ncbi:MAG: ABC transporter ATP-binding protein [Planctomycetota bacterium]|nr:ABC transporter ATP-binding protein [Planctomycetota bacterium]